MIEYLLNLVLRVPVIMLEKDIGTGEISFRKYQYVKNKYTSVYLRKYLQFITIGTVLCLMCFTDIS